MSLRAQKARRQRRREDFAARGLLVFQSPRHRGQGSDVHLIGPADIRHGAFSPSQVAAFFNASSRVAIAVPAPGGVEVSFKPGWESVIRQEHAAGATKAELAKRHAIELADVEKALAEAP
jgi:hypothetical protein